MTPLAMSVTSSPSRSVAAVPEPELVVGAMDHGHRHPARADEHRALGRVREADRRRGVDGVGGHDHGEVRDGARPGDVLDGVVGRPQLPVRDAPADAHQLDVGSRVGGIDLDLLERAAGQERRGGAHERDAAPVGEPGADAHQVLLRDTHVDDPRRGTPCRTMLTLVDPRESLTTTTTRGSAADQVEERLREGVAAVVQRASVAAVAVMPPLPGRPSSWAWSSATARSYSSAVGTWWCHADLVAHERHAVALVGVGDDAAGSAGLERHGPRRSPAAAAWSWPSTSRTLQPKARHLSASGSSRMVDFGAVALLEAVAIDDDGQAVELVSGRPPSPPPTSSPPGARRHR